MARLVLTVAGSALGNLILPGLGSAIGGAIGNFVGGLIDQQLFGQDGQKQTVVGPRLQDLRVQSSGYGSVIPRLYGKGRLAGNVIWMRGFHEELRTESQTVGGGGKGGGQGRQRVTNVTYTYHVDLALALCEGPIGGVTKVLVDGNALGAENYADMRVHPGSATQAPDPLIQAVEGTSNTPAYRGLAYVVMERLAITPFGNRVPNLSFELTT